MDKIGYEYENNTYITVRTHLYSLLCYLLYYI